MPPGPTGATGDDITFGAVASFPRAWGWRGLSGLLGLALVGCGPSSSPAPAASASDPAPGAAMPVGGASDAALPSSSPEALKGELGAACVRDGDCAGEGAVCLVEGHPGGSCARPCAGSCGEAGALCVADGLIGPGRCVPGCGGARGCREGYGCGLARHLRDAERLAPVCQPASTIAPPATDCQRQLAERGVAFFSEQKPPESPPGRPEHLCVVRDPVWLAGPVGGVRFVDAAGRDGLWAGCDLALSLVRAAAVLRELKVAEVRHLGAYNCRTLRGKERLSLHAQGLALDVSALVTDRGEVVSIRGGWERDAIRPSTSRGRLLASFAQRLHDDQIFNIVLTPEYNQAHADHLHLDLTPDRHFISRGPNQTLLGPEMVGD